MYRPSAPESHYFVTSCFDKEISASSWSVKRDSIYTAQIPHRIPCLEDSNFRLGRGRITPLSEILRHIRLVELPKLFNVLRQETTLARLLELD
jgi:hypothetical protein